MTLCKTLFNRWVPGVILGGLLLGGADAAEYRAFWVDAWGAGILKQSEVDTLLGVPGTTTPGRIRDANCNTVFVQVRRNCDANYPSTMGEPYMSGLSPANFNALQAVINAAHDTTGGKKRIEVHAWMVAFRTSGGAVYALHDDTPTGSLTTLDNYWPSRDNTGAEVSDKAFDPGHPLALQYTVNVAMDLVNNFDIDGIHYDYIRFTAKNQGYNPTSIARYNARYGLTGQPLPDNAQFMQWRRDQVTALVRQVYARIQKSKPWVKQSGAFVTWNPSPTASTRAQFQATRPYGAVYLQDGVYCDWDAWQQEGIVDIAVPMTYYDWGGSYPADYTRWINFEKDRKFNRHMIIGPGIYLNSLANAITVIKKTREPSPAGNYAHGFCGYSYRVPYVGGTWTGFSPSLVAEVTPTWDDIPTMPWKTSPTTGHLMGTVTLCGNGAWADGAQVSLSGPVSRSQYVDGTGFYAFIDLPPGNYTVTASKSGHPSAQATVGVAVGAVTGNMYERNLALGGPILTAHPQSQTVCAGATASFTVAGTGSPTPTVEKWEFNGGSGWSAIAGASGLTYSFAAQTSDSGRQYRATLTNACGSVTSSPATLTVNASPAGGADAIATPRNTPALIGAAKLKANDTGSGLQIIAVTAGVGGNAGSVSLSGVDGVVTYTPKADYAGSDSFTYTLRNASGCTAPVTVAVTIGAGQEVSANVVFLGTEGGQFVARFAGIPGYTYTVETNAVLSGPGWTKLGPVNFKAAEAADQSPHGIGVFQVVDPLGGTERYYRTVWPAY